MSEERNRGTGGRRGLILLVVVILLVLLIEGAVVAAVFVSPTASEKLGNVAAAADRAWSGTEDQAGLRTRSATAARTAYEEWLVPLWKGTEPPPADPAFTACVDCHPDYARQRAFTVYMNHPVHAEIGLTCDSCHPQSPHPNPPRPVEKVCAECHAEVEDSETCGFCHPPGSLPHFYLLGAPRTASVRCDVCHPKGAFEMSGSEPLVEASTFTGADEDTCLACHEDTTCARCHGEPHPLGWASSHGVGVGYGGATSCRNCHSATWCADRCHAVTDVNPFVPKPLPTSGVRP